MNMCMCVCLTHSGAVFLHGMGQLVRLGCSSGKEAVLTDIKIETFQATVPEGKMSHDDAPWDMGCWLFCQSSLC